MCFLFPGTLLGVRATFWGQSLFRIVIFIDKIIKKNILGPSIQPRCIMKIQKVVLAYSGGLDTSIIVKWLIETYGCEVVCFAADVGQEEELDGLEEKAKKTGASKCYIEDLQGGVRPRVRLPGHQGERDIRKPVPARDIPGAPRDREEAGRDRPEGEGRRRVPRRDRQGQRPGPLRDDLHGAGPGPHDHRPLADLGPELALACSSTTRRSTASRCPVTKDKPYSMDRNILHISYEGGILEDPYREPDESMFLLTKSPEKAPGQADLRRDRFRAGRARSRWTARSSARWSS